ncbi:THxN family PEP-CTERM protein [Phenylobacterium sp.]|uniref:THxN family PEP-CTERM protein n=1 Tax=Phenylobacterium sp. TaxID=1871053 RepID=UPI0025FDEC1D|nr:THxN family PEP-CTERM protein [Phenylobacterium sp.]
MRACSIGVAATAFLALGAAAVPAVAATILFTDFVGFWSDPVGANVVQSGSGTTEAHAAWGKALAKSSYVFSGASDVSTSLDDAASPFTIGAFTHNNAKINGGSISGITLSVSTSVFVDGVDQGVRNFVYGFDHWETPNNVSGANGVCANGERERDAINLYGCADRVRATLLKSAELVKINGKYYALDISGLIHNGNPVEEFWTRENESNSAELRAQLRLVSAVVPEPANWAMMIVGFGVAGAAVRAGRRRNILAT